MDQNTACDSAMPMRETINELKLQANVERTWLATKRLNSTVSSNRRSTFRVSSINGRDSSATTQA